MELAPLVLCAFGTTVPEARATYERFEKAVRERYPGHEVRWAYTSSIVRRALAREGLMVSGPLDVLANLRAAGATTAVVQPLYISPGQEFEQLVAIQIPNLRIVFGRPLLDTSGDQERVLDALADEWREDAPNVVVAHGNATKFEYNLTILEFAKLLRRRHSNAVLASLEGEPGVQPLDSIRLAVARTGKVHFVPLLFVAGDHVLTDVLGDGSKSWKKRLGAASATCAPPLGENPKVIDVFLDHIGAALKAAVASKA